MTDQAKEIIRRTDSLFTQGYGGNDHAWEERLARRLRKPYMHPYAKREMPAIMEGFRRDDAWRERWGCLPTQYVHNSWLSTCFIGGRWGAAVTTDAKHAARFAVNRGFRITGCTCGWLPKDESEAGDVEDQFGRHVAIMKAKPS